MRPRLCQCTSSRRRRATPTRTLRSGLGSAPAKADQTPRRTGTSASCTTKRRPRRAWPRRTSTSGRTFSLAKATSRILTRPPCVPRGISPVRPADADDAQASFKLAADAGIPEAMLNLANMLDQGLGIPQDKAAAADLRLRAEAKMAARPAAANET
mmetsp:Transcript_1433/g.5109  ORF Transcript_1433/g.5109 Transcript_1433/m.5109 type:complete len:156 (+) Transcript_1433:185-652(+)